MRKISININESIDSWHNRLTEEGKGNDSLLFCDNKDLIIWFTTNYAQYLIRKGENEVVILYGEQIDDLDALIYQINLSLPIGYKVKSNNHALYDMLLNFESEPKSRFIIWNDAQFLFELKRKEFEGIFESMVVAAYCNRNGISTIKEDNNKYVVNQKNIFLFEKTKVHDIENLLEKKYYIPSIDNPVELYQNIEFDIVELVE